MHIVIVGGLDRAEAQLERMAQQAGHSFELHTGHMGGRGSTNLESAIERAHLVIVVTDVNSHGAVQVTRKTANRLGRSLLIVRKCSTAALRPGARGAAPGRARPRKRGTERSLGLSSTA